MAVSFWLQFHSRKLCEPHTRSPSPSPCFSLAPGPRGDKGKPAKKNSKEDLDADLDSYFLKDEKTAAQVGTGMVYEVE